MKYLLLVHLKNTTESYYSDNPDELKEYAEFRKFQCWVVYELNRTVYSHHTLKVINNYKENVLNNKRRNNEFFV